MTDPNARVIIYSTSWCPWCTRAKELLDSRGIAYSEIDGEKEWGARFRDEIFARTGGMTVPQVVIDGKPIGGYSDLSKLDDSGELKRLLA